MAIRRVKYQIFSKAVGSAGAEVEITGNADSLYKKATGVWVNTTDANGIKKSTFTKFNIDSQDVFPDGIEAILLNTGQDVPPDDRYKELDERAEDTEVRFKYKDGSAASVTYPYTVEIYLRLENPPYKKTEAELLEAILERLGNVEEIVKKVVEKPA